MAKSQKYRLVVRCSRLSLLALLIFLALRFITSSDNPQQHLKWVSTDDTLAHYEDGHEVDSVKFQQAIRQLAALPVNNFKGHGLDDSPIETWDFIFQAGKDPVWIEFERFQTGLKYRVRDTQGTAVVIDKAAVDLFFELHGLMVGLPSDNVP